MRRMRQAVTVTLLSGALVAGTGAFAANADTATPGPEAAPASAAPLQGDPAGVSAAAKRKGFTTSGLPGVHGWGTYETSSYKGHKTRLVWFQIRDDRKGKRAALEFALRTGKNKGSYDRRLYWNPKDGTTTRRAGFHSYNRGDVLIRELLGYPVKKNGKTYFKITNSAGWRVWR
jgi:hypothetical protein